MNRRPRNTKDTAMSETTTAQPGKNLRFKGMLIALVGAALMSLDPVFIRFSGVDELETTFLFGLFTAISMAVAIQVTDKRGLFKVLIESGWPVIVAGILMLGSSTGLVFAIKNTSVVNTFVILSAIPAVAALFGWIFLRERVSKQTMFAIIGVIVGIVVVVSGSTGGGASSLYGDLLALFAVPSWR